MAFFKENENNMQRIKVLEMQLTPTVSKSQECQTKNETEYVEIACTECIFLASCEDELNYHMGEEHDKDFISYFESDFPCSVCDRWCRTEKELTRHTKIFHNKRVKNCTFECVSCEEELENKNKNGEHISSGTEICVVAFVREFLMIRKN